MLGRTNFFELCCERRKSTRPKIEISPVPGSEVPAFSAAEMHLELWMDKGLLTGRYRAWLPDFDGVKRVDLSLSGKAGSGHTQTLTFHSANPEAEGPLGRSVRPVLTMAAERF